MQKPRICFAGTPAFAAAHLSALLSAEHNVVAVYTQPDRPAGRGKKLQPSAVKALALASSIPVHQPASLKPAEQHKLLADIEADVLIVVAYGLILPQAILDIPRLGCVNVHASLLPRWRGAAPIERALLAGDKVTGVTIMQMDAGLDTGDMLTTEEVDIGSEDTRMDLEDKLTAAGNKALLRILEDLPNAQKNAVKQDPSQSTYASKLDKSESLIQWAMPAGVIDRQVRACIGRSPAYCFLDGQRLRILSATPIDVTSSEQPGTIVHVDKSRFRVACENSELAVHSVQLPGKTAMGIGDILNSQPTLFTAGKLLRNSENPDT